jgi:uncharacterized membrane protein
LSLEQERVFTRAWWRYSFNVQTLRGVYDLLLFAGLALLLPGLLLLPVPVLRLPVGLALALFGPGYTLAAALFAHRDDFDGIGRAALSFGLSIAVLPVLALLLDALPWGLRPWPMTITVSAWVWLFCGIAAWRRHVASATGQAYVPHLPGESNWWQGLSRRNRQVLVLAALVLSGLLAGGAVALPFPDQGAPPTEFYILGQEGLAEDYPRQTVVGEPISLQLGVANREPSERTYRIEIWVTKPWEPDQRVLVGKTGPLTLLPNQQQEQPASWRMPSVGDDQRIEFLLFDGQGSAPYRQLQLWLNVVDRIKAK